MIKQNKTKQNMEIKWEIDVGTFTSSVKIFIIDLNQHKVRIRQ